ncbi:transmembrane protein 72 isoform X2 [Brachyhypopomus gauderio]|uniref:transmembrane protein 72 isoform X2 n=1 Tax=Brachyhypopomus gauderio TaxID=698409 RepID=UPI004040FF64
MGGSTLWLIVECACKVLGITTPAVCAVGVQTLRLADFRSLAVYLLYPPTCKYFIMWKKLTKIGSFQKFLYYTMMSVVCFLHPVLDWHAAIPGTLLLVTGCFNFILSKRRKTSTPEEHAESYRDPELTGVCITESEETEPTFAFLHIISGKRAFFVPDNSRLLSPSDSSQAILGTDCSPQPAHRPMKRAGRANVHFIESFGQDDTEIDEYCTEPEETTSNKAPVITL